MTMTARRQQNNPKPDRPAESQPGKNEGWGSPAGAVIDGSKDPIASRRFDELIEAAQIAIEPVTEAQARVARQAYRDFGKTSGHPAKLNFGDCFSYAPAKSKGEPLLFKGQGFSRTDVKSARA
jgi:ribonuclease VapC